MAGPLRLGLVGPVPPPNGGMAMQTRQLARLLAEEGVVVDLLPTNAAYRPAFIGRVRGVRALFRLLPYLWRAWQLAARVDVIHLMANSGWSWQLFSAPVLWLASWRKTPVIVNYRGGEARSYLQRSAVRIKPSLARAACVVVPSGFLQQVFGEYGIGSSIVPNIIDTTVFYPPAEAPAARPFTLVVTRNLEPIYGIETAIDCLAQVQRQVPDVQLRIAGSGPQQPALMARAAELGLTAHVHFLGRLERADIVALYQHAHVMINPARVDNMPNSVLEALACGVPVVSTEVGGVPYLVAHDETALLVPVDDASAMAKAILRLHADASLRARLSSAGRELVRQFVWPQVKQQWLQLYRTQVAAA